MVCTKNFVGGHPVHVVVVGVDLRDPMRGSTGQRSGALHVERMLRHWLRKRSRRMGVSRRRCRMRGQIANLRQAGTCCIATAQIMETGNSPTRFRANIAALLSVLMKLKGGSLVCDVTDDVRSLVFLSPSVVQT